MAGGERAQGVHDLGGLAVVAWLERGNGVFGPQGACRGGWWAAGVAQRAALSVISALAGVGFCGADASVSWRPGGGASAG